MKPATTTSTAPVTTRHRITELIDAFINEQDVKPATRQAYKQNITLYMRWIDNKGYDLAEIRRTQIIEYKEYLIREGRATLTISAYLTAIRRFYEWAESHRLYPNVAKGIRSPKEKKAFRKQPLNVNQTTDMLIMCMERRAQLHGEAKRFVAINYMMLTMGLRTCEVSRANVEDIVWKYGRRAIMIQGKGHNDKDTAMELTPEVYEAIFAYLEARGNPKKGPLFVSSSNNHKGQRLSTRTISAIVKQGLKDIGINDPTITAHSLRHTAATNLIEAGGTFADAQAMLRHTDIATTMVYTHFINERKRFERTGESVLQAFYNKAMEARKQQQHAA